MNDIHILVTMPQHAVFRTFFDADAMAALEHIGTVHWNTLGRQYTQDELGAAVRGMDICVTGWGTPVFDEAVLAQADRLRLHCPHGRLRQALCDGRGVWPGHP